MSKTQLEFLSAHVLEDDETVVFCVRLPKGTTPEDLGLWPRRETQPDAQPATPAGIA